MFEFGRGFVTDTEKLPEPETIDYTMPMLPNAPEWVEISCNQPRRRGDKYYVITGGLSDCAQWHFAGDIPFYWLARIYAWVACKKWNLPFHYKKLV